MFAKNGARSLEEASRRRSIIQMRASNDENKKRTTDRAQALFVWQKVRGEEDRVESGGSYQIHITGLVPGCFWFALSPEQRQLRPAPLPHHWLAGLEPLWHRIACEKSRTLQAVICRVALPFFCDLHCIPSPPDEQVRLTLYIRYRVCCDRPRAPAPFARHAPSSRDLCQSSRIVSMRNCRKTGAHGTMRRKTGVHGTIRRKTRAHGTMPKTHDRVVRSEAGLLLVEDAIDHAPTAWCFPTLLLDRPLDPRQMESHSESHKTHSGI